MKINLKSINDFLEKLIKIVEKATEAQVKQNPKQIIHTDNNYLCPVCNHVATLNYCSYCGQKLKY